MGIPIDAYTPDRLIHDILTASRSDQGGYLVTSNLDHLRCYTRDPQLHAWALAADIRVADGKPLLWASRLQGTPLPARVAGSDLIYTLSRALADDGASLFCVGGAPGTAEAAAKILQQRFPGLRVVGAYCPPFGFEQSEDEIDELVAMLKHERPRFVYLGLPFAKASAIVDAARPDLPAAWFLGVGISFSFVTGDVTRAPNWMQRVGLEWLHRLAQEPRRLGRRYLVEGLVFFACLLFQSVRTRFNA